MRGGISDTLALSLPSKMAGQAVPEREIILVITYVVVVFSILVQGLTIGPLTQRWLKKDCRWLLSTGIFEQFQSLHHRRVFRQCPFLAFPSLTSPQRQRGQPLLTSGLALERQS